MTTSVPGSPSSDCNADDCGIPFYFSAVNLMIDSFDILFSSTIKRTFRLSPMFLHGDGCYQTL